jgi:putative tricarboxylic transport membrane protein
LAVVVASVIFFGLAVGPLGFLPTLAFAVMLSTMASMRFRVISSILLTAGLVVLCWAVFIRGIGLPLQLIGPWLGGY